MRKLSERLNDLIEESGITQKELSGKISLAPQTINNYVKGNRMPDLETLEKLCDVFDCSADYLIGRSSIKKPHVTGGDMAILAAYHAASDRDREIIDKLLGLGDDAAAEPANEKSAAS